MKLTRREAMVLPAGLAAASVLPGAIRAEEPQVDGDGLYTQPWFHSSFLDLREDVAEAQAEGKSLAILWEQNACPYCREMHRVNLADKSIVDYIRKHFIVLQLNLYGSRSVTDFDGEEMEERKLARRWRVNFTPTISFFPKDPGKVDGKPGRDVEAFRLTGYWKPFHFRSTFVYVETGGYESEPNFQRWLSDYREKLREAGENVDIW